MTNPTQHGQVPEALKSLAHELFTMAQCAPGEGIEDAVARISATLHAQQPAPATQQEAPADELGEVLRERDDAEDFINELLDEVLGADRPEWSSAYNRYDAMNDVRERITALHKPAVDKAWGQFESAMAAPQPSPTAQADSVQEDAARLLALEAAANQIFNNPPSETSQDVRDVIEWFSGSIRVVLDAARKQGASHD